VPLVPVFALALESHQRILTAFAALT